MQPLHYHIAPLDPHAHVFEVRCTVAQPDPAGQRFRLPAWIPGSYLIREFARQFVQVRAESADGAVTIAKEAKDTWRTAPTAGPVTVIAHVYAYDLSVRTAYLDGARAYFNGPSVFLLPDGYEREECTVEISPPAGDTFAHWRVATTLAADGAAPYGFGRYRAGSYDELIDHPVEMSDFALAAFAAGGVRHEITLTGRQQADLERLARDLARVCQWQVDLFGGARRSRAPFDRYLFQITSVVDGYGGLEHRSSTSLLCRRDELPVRGRVEISDKYLNLLGLASHEYFHAWNVKRIKPEAFSPYDLARENYTRQLWAFEGITSYYDDLALVRSGLIDEARYLELLGRTITNVLRTPGRHSQSVGDSSFDAWIKFYRQDENSPNAVVSYYAKGSVVALALDLTLRKAGRASLDHVMRTLWERYGTRGIGVPEGGIEAIVNELAGTDMREFFMRYVEGTDDPNLRALLGDFAVDWHVRASNSGHDRGGKPTSGPLPAAWVGMKAGPDLRLQYVFNGSPAERAGLAAHDVLVAIDGVRASADSLNLLLTDRAPGEHVSIHAFRRDELVHFELELSSPPLDTCYLTVRTDAAADSIALRRAWLGPDNE
jgi:predicted metalloprotease with PDZ domain